MLSIRGFLLQDPWHRKRIQEFTQTLRRLPWQTVLALPLSLFVVVACGGSSLATAAELPAVSTFELGSFTLHLASRPFRWSWFKGEKRLGAERYRRQVSALSVEQAGCWQALEGLISARHSGESAVVAEVAFDQGRSTATVELEALSGDAGELVRIRLGVPGATAIREDVVIEADELLLASSGSPCLVLSSGACAFFLRSADNKPLKAYAPDPDHFRFETSGDRLELELWPCGPQEALRRRDRLLLTRERQEGPPIEIADKPSLHAAIEALSRDAIAFNGLRSLRLVEAPVSVVLRDGVQSLAVLLPGEFRFAGPSAPRLERLHAALHSKWEALRPLALDFSSDRQAWRARAEWLLGSDLLVAPFLQPGPREVWLPPGVWERCGPEANGVPLTGPATIRVEPELGLPAVFVRREQRQNHATLRAVWSAK